MGHKHLHELLQEDQEPFHLKTFISDRRKPTSTTTATTQKPHPLAKRQKPINKNINFCLNFSSHDSPSFTKSPFLDFPARESKSPCNNAAVFLNIPARTATMLLDAATRVQKPKQKTGSRHTRFGLLGSLLRRLKDRTAREKTLGIEPGNGSCSSRLVNEFEEVECLCSSPSSPFRFSLQRSPSPVRQEPESSSPVASSSCQLQQDKEGYEVGRTEETNMQNDDEKEQCSPVSVLDPLFDDDEEEHDGGDTEEDGYDIECSYANVQRAKHQLLQKLKRFERLAGLDPIDLENRMLEQCSNEDEDEDVDVLAYEEEWTNEECFREIVNHLGVVKIPWYMKKLVLDLIAEENKNGGHEMIVQRVCKRLHLWKVVDLNTIDMIVESEFISEGWKWCDKETIRDIGMDIETAIFGFLLEELAQELVC